MKCPSCGSKQRNSAKFCDVCGASLNEAPQPGEPRKNSRKALWISLIALVLVAAIAAGTIIIINNNSVSAAELEEAKEKFLPPAQAVQIDKSLSDPSNNKIKFKYDDRSRIISCTYTANEKTYDQKYSYDDTARKVDIETSYKKRPIFHKEIPYDRVPKPNEFVDIDGYYLRLDDDCIDDTPDDDEAPTDAPAPDPTEKPTEPPEEEPTEKPTEPPAEPQASYKDIYLDFLDATDIYYAYGGLVYLNDDDTPEMILKGGSGVQVSYYVCYVSGSDIHYEVVDSDMNQITYRKRSGLIRKLSAHPMYTSWQFYVFDGRSLFAGTKGGVFKSYDSQTNSTNTEFKIDDQPVSEEEYNSIAGDDSTWIQFEYELTDSGSLPDFIRNY